MGREVLFRAKHIHKLPQNWHLDGRWVEGYLSDERHINSIGIGGDLLVDPETVCQFTGLADESGRRYEGDIFQASDGEYMHRYAITWGEDSLGWQAECIDDPDGTLPLSEFPVREIQVIGNIFDNPEMLKVQEGKGEKMKEKIIDEIKKAVKEGLGAGYEVSFKEVPKTNCIKTAIIIKHEGERGLPVIYIDGLLQEINKGAKDVQQAAEEIAGIYMDVDKERGYKLGKMMNKENILQNVVYQMINAEYNGKLLEGTPHKKIFDLAAVYRVILNEKDGWSESVLMTDGLCGAYGIREGELDAAAWRNTKEKGFLIRTMSEFVAQITGVTPSENGHCCPEMYILTNKKHNNGASVMLYGECFESLAEKLGDLYVLPASIHEVIAIPAYGMDPVAVRQMVMNINDKEVPCEEVLGQNIYRYSIGAGLSIV